MNRTEKPQKPGFCRISVEPKKHEYKKNNNKSYNKQDDHLYMKLTLGNHKSLWMPIGISPELLKSYLDILTAES